jgi:hypothetical protein
VHVQTVVHGRLLSLTGNNLHVAVCLVQGGHGYNWPNQTTV